MMSPAMPTSEGTRNTIDPSTRWTASVPAVLSPGIRSEDAGGDLEADAGCHERDIRWIEQDSAK